MKRLMKIAALLLVVPAVGRSQDVNEQPRTLAHIFAGFATHRMALNAGFGAEFRLYKGLAVGPEFAAAGIGGRANSDPASNPNIIGLGSLDASYHFYNKGARGRLAPFVAGGYTAFFGQDTDTPSGSLQHGYNVGGGVDLFASKHVGVRFDVRHYGHGGRILWASFPADCGAYPLMPSPCELSFTAFRIGVTFR